MEESKRMFLTREDIQNILGCRIVWHASSMRTNAQIQVRFVPLSSLQELIAYWQEHGWQWLNSVNIWTDPLRYLKPPLYLDGVLGQYDHIYINRAGGFLYHPFHASGTHYLCQHWQDPLPAELGQILYDLQYELRPMRFVDIVVKDQPVFSPTLDQILNHFVGGTQGDWNYPFPLLIKHWQDQPREE